MVTEKQIAQGIKNLKPCKPGERRNPAGRPPGETFKGLLTKLLNGKITVPDLEGRKRKLTRREVLALTLIKDAMDVKNTASERTKANQTIQDRVEGKAVQPISAAPDTEVHITISPAENKL